jgi:hypothetical protein
MRFLSQTRSILLDVGALPRPQQAAVGLERRLGRLDQALRLDLLLAQGAPDASPTHGRSNP